jgi:hypothetical protein
MKIALKYSLAILLLALAVPVAHAGGRDDPHNPPPSPPKKCDPPATAPEVEPSMAFAGLTLLGGTPTVLRSRRRTKA